MTTRPARDDFDRLMAEWMASNSHIPDPEELNEAVIGRTRRARQLPAWLVPGVDLRMRLALAAARAPGPAWVLLLLLLVLGLVVAAVVGNRPRIPDPLGLAAPGAISFISEGHVVIVEPDGSHRIELKHDSDVAARPQFSRLGTKVAFITSVDGRSAQGELHVVNADGTNDVAIESDATSISPVSWDPSDRLLTYSKFVDGKQVVVVARADGSGITQVSPTDQSAWAPAFSPDGSKIAYLVGFPTVAGVYVVSADGSRPRAITTRSTGDYDDLLHWSPDGSQVVLGIGTTGDHDVVALGVDEPAEQIIVPGSTDDRYPVWAPDGSLLAFDRLGPAGAIMSVVDSRGGNVRELANGFIAWAPEWSPDAERLIATRIETRATTVAAVAALVDPDGILPTTTIELGSVPADSNLPGYLAAEISWQRRAP